MADDGEFPIEAGITQKDGRWVLRVRAPLFALFHLSGPLQKYHWTSVSSAGHGWGEASYYGTPDSDSTLSLPAYEPPIPATLHYVKPLEGGGIDVLARDDGHSHHYVPKSRVFDAIDTLEVLRQDYRASAEQLRDALKGVIASLKGE